MSCFSQWAHERRHGLNGADNAAQLGVGALAALRLKQVLLFHVRQHVFFGGVLSCLVPVMHGPRTVVLQQRCGSFAVVESSERDVVLSGLALGGRHFARV